MKILSNIFFGIFITFGFIASSALAQANIKSEKETLAQLEQQSLPLLSMKAAGECTTTCNKNYYYPYDTVCKTSCPDGSSPGNSYSAPSCGPKAFIVGCLIGGLIGSLGTPIGTAMTAGCVVGGGIFYAGAPDCN